MSEHVDNHNRDVHVTLGVIHADLGYMKTSLAEIKEIIGSFKKDYITREEFTPVKMLVYSFAGLIMTGFLVALISQVVR